MKAFYFQYKSNPIYHTYCNHLGLNSQNVNTYEKIPFLPISFFKTHEIYSTSINSTTITYTSSGTSGKQTSKHFLSNDIFYLQNARLQFEEEIALLEDCIFLCLLPSYLERKGSSLIAMANNFIKASNHSLSGFFLNEYDILLDTINKALHTDRKIVLLGVTFGLIDFLEKHSISLRPQDIVMETGGMKGRRKEMTRGAVHQFISSKTTLPNIYSEYGMTELLSQGYSKGKGIFSHSKTMKALIREFKDPLSVHEKGKGALNIIDLANIESCCFIATDDQGSVSSTGFEVLGRIDHSDIRGCNLMVY